MNVIDTYKLTFTENEVRFLLDYTESVYQLLEKHGVCLNYRNRAKFYKSSLNFFIDFKKEEFPFTEINEVDYEIAKEAKLNELENLIKNTQRKE